MQYDVIIIGSGLGGLLCANILSLQGKKVCVVEKNKQFGGNLQTFSRNKQIFDTGVHYIGGLEKGQTLYQIFKYAGIIHSLKLKKMDGAFDRIWIGNQLKEYAQHQGWGNFKQKLKEFFPEEGVAIDAYVEKVKTVCAQFSLYNLHLDDTNTEKFSSSSLSAKQFIESLTENKNLQAVLAGNNLLYAGQANTTPFHMHALITNSYVESSWKCVDGGSQIAKILVANIRKNGSQIMRNTRVEKIVEKDGTIDHVVLENNKKLFGKYFISNIHPADTLEITASPQLKSLYRKRINSLPNTIGSFSLHLVLEEKAIAYRNYNCYYHKENLLWDINNYTDDDWPRGYGLYFIADRKDPSFASAISILTPMRFEEVALWEKTYNRAGAEATRSKDYEYFKKRKAEILLNLVEERLPNLRKCTKHYYTSTPLTNRDYIGGKDGSMYGIQKDFHDAIKTMLSPRTKISNLFLTGQNVNLHGILGTSLTAVLTCSLLLNDPSLINKIRNA